MPKMTSVPLLPVMVSAPLAPTRTVTTSDADPPCPSLPDRVMVAVPSFLAATVSVRFAPDPDTAPVAIVVFDERADTDTVSPSASVTDSFTAAPVVDGSQVPPATTARTGALL